MSEPLFFRRFDLTEVVVPVHEEIVANPEGLAPEWALLPIVLVEGHLSNGLIALGEMGRGISREETKNVLRKLAGCNLLETLPEVHWGRSQIPRGLTPLFPEGGWEVLGAQDFGLIESLVFDALGKTFGVPIHFFWGGARSARVSVDFWCGRPPPQQARLLARRAVAGGFRGLKMKAFRGEEIIETARAMREEVGRSFRLTIDPMCHWRSFAESAFIFEELVRMGGYWQVEDPFPHAAVDCWRQARARFGIPLMWHARSTALARTAFQLGVADGFNLVGTGSDFVFTARAAEFLGLSCWHGTSLELGVRQHFLLHSTAAVGNATLGNDLQGVIVRQHSLVTPVMEIRDGCATVPQKPGLGVELDRPAVERYAVARESFDLE